MGKFIAHSGKTCELTPLLSNAVDPLCCFQLLIEPLSPRPRGRQRKFFSSKTIYPLQILLAGNCPHFKHVIDILSAFSELLFLLLIFHYLIYFVAINPCIFKLDKCKSISQPFPQ